MLVARRDPDAASEAFPLKHFTGSDLNSSKTVKILNKTSDSEQRPALRRSLDEFHSHFSTVNVKAELQLPVRAKLLTCQHTVSVS